MSTSTEAASAGTVCRVHVEVGSTDKPRPGPKRHTYVCEADLLVSESTESAMFHEQLMIHHPRGWMGVAAAFDFDIDGVQYPTFEERASRARFLTLQEFPEDGLISVFLLGTGTPSV